MNQSKQEFSFEDQKVHPWWTRRVFFFFLGGGGDVGEPMPKINFLRIWSHCIEN